jgi:hypothetical protein
LIKVTPVVKTKTIETLLWNFKMRLSLSKAHHQMASSLYFSLTAAQFLVWVNKEYIVQCDFLQQTEHIYFRLKKLSCLQFDVSMPASKCALPHSTWQPPASVNFKHAINTTFKQYRWPLLFAGVLSWIDSGNTKNVNN